MSWSANTSGVSMRACSRSCSLSNTRARPTNRLSTIPVSTPASLSTAPPSGATLPDSRRSPPVGLNGADTGWTTSPSGAGGSIRATCSASVSPVHVIGEPSSTPASSSSLTTTGRPPTASMSTMLYFPNGRALISTGTVRESWLNSFWDITWFQKSMPAARAISGACNTTLVEPPIAMATIVALRNAVGVAMSRGVIPRCVMISRQSTTCSGNTSVRRGGADRRLVARDDRDQAADVASLEVQGQAVVRGLAADERVPHLRRAVALAVGDSTRVVGGQQAHRQVTLGDPAPHRRVHGLDLLVHAHVTDAVAQRADHTPRRPVDPVDVLAQRLRGGHS